MFFSMNLNEYLKEYLLECKIRNLSHQTIVNKQIQLNVVTNYLKDELGVTKLEKIKKVHIKAYLNNKLESDCKASTINTSLKILKSFFTYGIEEDYIQTNPARDIKLLKREKAIFTVFNDNEIVNMVKYWKGTTYTAIKNKLMISLLVDTGIRVGELCSLLIENVEDDHIKVHGKGNKWRIVPISFQLRKLMMKYERKRKEVLEKNNKELDYYFFNQHKHKYESVSPIQKMIKYTAQKVKVRSSVRTSPHTLRHYYAIKSLSLGTPITQLSKNLGHESIRTTEIYLTQITNEQVISEQMKKTVSPLSKI